MKMSEISVSDRPREKMIRMGTGALTDSELLAVIIGSGTREENVVDLSRRVISESGGSLSTLFGTTMDRLTRIHGLGPCRATQVQAALELGRRFFQQKAEDQYKTIVSSQAAYEFLLPVFKGLRTEECWVLFLSPANGVLGKSRMTVGSAEQTVIDPREIVRLALDKNASGVILFHNHPSGDPRPSDADIKWTEKVREALETFQIALLDHIIVGDSRYFSFADGK